MTTLSQHDKLWRALAIRPTDETLDEAIDLNLTERQVRVIRTRFGLEDNRPQTLKAAGADIGITAERVRQIEAESLRILRQKMTTTVAGR